MRIRSVMAGAVISVLGLVGGAAAGSDLPEAAVPPSSGPQSSETPAPGTPASVAQLGAGSGTTVPGNPQRSAIKEENKEIVELQDVHALLGKEVRSATGEQMGRIVNVLIDGTGVPRAAVIDFGGFLGVGIRKIAVDWGALRFSPYQNYERITAALTRDQVKAAPEFKDEQKTVQAIGIAGAISGQ